MMLVRVLVLSLTFLIWGHSGAEAAKRLALVIGNDAYSNLPANQQLRKAANDARAMARAFEGLGFDTLLGINLGRSAINLHLQQLANKVEPGDTVAVFFAGHGVRVDGLNYLLPSDVPQILTGQEGFLKSESVRVDTITDTLNAKGARITLLILDACRDNPFQDSKGRSVGGTRGLARMAPAQGTFVMFSAGAGQQALDRLSNADANPNSVFTRTLLPLMTQPGLEIAALAKQVKRDVHDLALTASGHKQTPAVYNEMLDDFFLAGKGDGEPKASAAAPTPAPPPVATRSDSRAEAEIVFWQSVIANPTRESYEAYLQAYPDGQFAALAKARVAALERPTAPAPPPVRTAPVPESGFIFPDSDRRRLTRGDLIGLNKRDLRIARNEIYARKGRYFKSRDLQIHFGQFPWYQPYTWKPRLNAIERMNVRMIQRFE